MSDSFGCLICRLCRLRDEMKKTPEGRRALKEVIDALKNTIKEDRTK